MLKRVQSFLTAEIGVRAVGNCFVAALIVIVLVGLGSVALAKYNYNKGPSTVEPTVGTTWYAGLAFDVCGTMEPVLPASPTSATRLAAHRSAVAIDTGNTP